MWLISVFISVYFCKQRYKTSYKQFCTIKAMEFGVFDRLVLCAKVLDPLNFSSNFQLLLFQWFETSAESVFLISSWILLKLFSLSFWHILQTLKPNAHEMAQNDNNVLCKCALKFNFASFNRVLFCLKKGNKTIVC